MASACLCRKKSLSCKSTPCRLAFQNRVIACQRWFVKSIMPFMVGDCLAECSSSDIGFARPSIRGVSCIAVPALQGHTGLDSPGLLQTAPEARKA